MIDAVPPHAVVPGAAGEADEDSGVIIIGAGFSGLCLAARLVRDGRRDFLILEKGEGVGGTWRDNRYPGCACDIPSHLYSLSFGPKPDWSRLYPTQPELRAYLEDVAGHFDLDPHLRLRTVFERADWDEADGRWVVTARDGRRFAAPVLVSGVGALHQPEKPHLPGIERFAGDVFHSAEWPDGFDPAGRNIAVIGTGASAIQFVPRLAETAARVMVFQRTAPWVLPKHDRVLSPGQRWVLRHVPLARRTLRWTMYWLHEARLLTFLGRRDPDDVVQRYARGVIARAVPDRDLRRRVTPDYQLGCKRTLLSNDYYPALSRPNVAIVTAPIARVEADAILTADGRRLPADTLVFGTGFKVIDALKTLEVRGRGGRRLDQAWADGPAAYLGISVPGFPNFFLMLGPNTGLGHNSQVFMIEAQADHILAALRLMRRWRAATMEVDAARHAAFDADTQRRLAGSVWARGGCRSWYQDPTGRVVALWPRATFVYRYLCRRWRPGDYRLVRVKG